MTVTVSIPEPAVVPPTLVTLVLTMDEASKLQTLLTTFLDRFFSGRPFTRESDSRRAPVMTVRESLLLNLDAAGVVEFDNRNA